MSGRREILRIVTKEITVAKLVSNFSPNSYIVLSIARKTCDSGIVCRLIVTGVGEYSESTLEGYF